MTAPASQSGTKPIFGIPHLDNKFHPLSWAQLALLCVTAILTFHLAYSFGPVSLFMVVFLLSLFALHRAGTPRQAFFAGLVVGFGIYAPQLAFFWSIFSYGAVALWCVLAFWIGLFVLLARSCSRRTPAWATALVIPFLWSGLEYIRSELYYLRFSWLNAGFAFTDANCLPVFAWLGVYGLGFGLMLVVALLSLLPRRISLAVGAMLCAGLSLIAPLPSASQSEDSHNSRRLKVAGVQLEFPDENQVLSALDKLIAQVPTAGLLVLSEYTFDRPLPDIVKKWCRTHQKHLIVGGKSPAPNSNFYNTAFVIGPSGEIIFEQSKVVPIQFFNDGLPAPAQKVWDSPWGKLGICICYDLSYARVTDELIRQGAQALIVPAMDIVEWGEHQHALHARVAPMRAAEYRVPIFRLASSGISQHVDARGRVLASASFPGQGEIISGDLVLVERGRLPIDRFLCPLAVGVTGLVVAWLVLARLSDRPRAIKPSSA